MEFQQVQSLCHDAWTVVSSFSLSHLLAKMYSFFPLLSLLSAACAATTVQRVSPRAPAGPPTVTLKNGSYYGVHNANYSQDFFLGIPFAQPPIGQLRFANPVSYNASWTGALPATNYAFVRL